MQNTDITINITRPVIARTVPFAVFMAFVIAGSLLPALPETWRTWDARHLFALRAVAVMLMLLVFWRDYSELRDLALSWRQAAASVIAGIAVFCLWIWLDQPWATFGETTGFDPMRGDGTPDLAWIAWRMLGLAVVVPVMEELFWRSFLLRWIQRANFFALDPHRVGTRAVVITAFLFASEHNLWLAGLIAGFVYNYLYIRTGNLWAPIISHASTNGMLGIWILATGSWQFW
jgi:CAAX prenyl protease-like protein